ncbi:hypothetical protein CMI47_21490 [Candidatus Pacearchaeota archaeon]|jgi:rubredoxin|nr:hypothetical protein [Candidatus Pacearchaeota archaeon]|tara:strand:+ start:335 stop:532 length:198 start_codon:yes stop_codon:yes gene_type:complete
MEHETCSECGFKLDRDEPVTIEGIADVYGITSLNGFMDEGIEWIPTNSTDEEWLCPQCRTKNKIE